MSVRRLGRLLDSGLLRLLVRDSMLAGLASGFSRLFLLGLSVVVSRTVASQQAFGLFSSALLFVQLAAMLASLGLAQTATQAIAARATQRVQQAQVVRSLVWVSVALGSAALVIIALAAPLLATAFGSKIPVSLLRAISILVFLQLFEGGLEGILRGLLAFRWLPAAAVAATGVALAAGYPLIVHFGPEGGLVTIGVFLLVQIAVMLVGVRVPLFGSMLQRSELRRLMGGVAAPTFMSGLFWNVAMMVPPLLLVRTSAGLREVALWNATSQLRTLISFAPIVIVNASIPHILDLIRQGQLTRKRIVTTLALPMGAALVPYLPAAAFSRTLMTLYGPQYGSHGGLLVLVLSYVLLQVLGVGLFGFVLASGRLWYAAFLNAAWCVVVLAATPFILPAAGVYGLAKLYLVTYVPVDLVLAILAAQAVTLARSASRVRTSVEIVAALGPEE